MSRPVNRSAGPSRRRAASVHGLAWSPDGGTLAVLTTRGKVTLLEAMTGNVVATPLGNTDVVVRSLAFSPDGTTLALGTLDGTIALWDTAGGQQRGAPLAGHTAAVLSVAYNTAGTLLASGSSDETVLVWDLASGMPGVIYRGHGDEVRAVAFRPDSDEIASGASDGSLVLWQPESRLVNPITTNEQDLRSVAFSGALTRLVFGYGGGDLYVWDLPAEAHSRGPMRLAGHIPETLGLSPDGALAASGDGRGNFVLWDVGERHAVGDPLRSPESSLDALFWLGQLGTGKGPQSMARTFEKVLFNPDGSRLATNELRRPAGAVGHPGSAARR